VSPLPERRKTPEELAELRQSLGIPAEAPPGPLNDSSPPIAKAEAESTTASPKPAEAELPPRQEVEDAPERVELPSEGDEIESLAVPTEDGEEVVRVGGGGGVKSLRKSAGLAVDQPKGQIARGDGGVIPDKRHSNTELNELRKAAQLAPPVGEIIPKSAHPVTLVALYGVASLVVLAGILGGVSQSVPVSDLPFEWLMRAVQTDSFSMILFAILCAGAGVFLLAAGWLAWKRPLSRHHAGFMTIIAVLVLVFGTLYSFPQLHGA